MNMILNSPSTNNKFETSAEKKGFFFVKQPSLVSTGTFIIPETLTVSSPDHSAYPMITRGFGDCENDIDQ